MWSDADRQQVAHAPTFPATRASETTPEPDPAVAREQLSATQGVSDRFLTLVQRGRDTPMPELPYYERRVLSRLSTSPRTRVRVLFFAVMLTLTTALTWLGWRLLDQDQQLATQRMSEQREAAADLVVAALERRFVEVERDLDRVLAGEEPATSPDPGAAVVLRLDAISSRAWPSDGLLYFPQVFAPSEPLNPSLERADALEFRENAHSEALRNLLPLVTASDENLAAAALVRIARNHAKTGNSAEALAAYAALQVKHTATVAGIPAPLAAQLGRLTMFEQAGNTHAAAEAARVLHDDVMSRRWPLSYANYRFLRERVAPALPESTTHAGGDESHPRDVVTEAVTSWWESSVRLNGAASGRTAIPTRAGATLVVWRREGPVFSVFALTAEGMDRDWLEDLRPRLQSRNVQLALTTPAGDGVIGRRTEPTRSAIRLASTTTLPWTVQLFDTTSAPDELQGRRKLLLGAMAVLLLLIASGGWFVGRSVTRELAVADLQSDFVAAVSHEFRTPLTTLCQLTELLVRNRVAAEEDRRQYYELLHGESHRLRRLVERLLDFGRLEAGKMPFTSERLDVVALVRQTSHQFVTSVQGSRHQVNVDAAAGHFVVADGETLRCVLWNLLENAAKYSPDGRTIAVDVRSANGRVEIAVRDRGLGIPRAEQRRVFDKFVRGSAAKRSEVRGTGIGLAMARAIVQAHGGTIRLESEVGRGSTLTVVLPQATS